MHVPVLIPVLFLFLCLLPFLFLHFVHVSMLTCYCYSYRYRMAAILHSHSCSRSDCCSLLFSSLIRLLSRLSLLLWVRSAVWFPFPAPLVFLLASTYYSRCNSHSHSPSQSHTHLHPYSQSQPTNRAPI